MANQKLSGLSADIAGRKAELYAWPIVALGINPDTGKAEPLASNGGGLAPGNYDSVTMDPEDDPETIVFSLGGNVVKTIYVVREAGAVTYTTTAPE